MEILCKCLVYRRLPALRVAHIWVEGLRHLYLEETSGLTVLTPFATRMSADMSCSPAQDRQRCKFAYFFDFLVIGVSLETR